MEVLLGELSEVDILANLPYRYPTTGPSLGELIDFLSDPKETDELFMVVDEELKMMSRVCEDARVVGPYLKEMSRLAHTEYFIEGRTKSDVREILKETLFAPTVTGSPLESASQDNDPRAVRTIVPGRLPEPPDTKLATGPKADPTGRPNQGVQKEINLFGHEVRVGFYNTFASHCETPTTQCVGVPAIEVARDEQTGEVHALRSANFRSVQFHPESILSPDGLNILKDMVKALLATEIAAWA
jgi:hypothetical protein